MMPAGSPAGPDRVPVVELDEAVWDRVIDVNAICPGLVDTERVYGIASGLKPEGVTTEDYRQVLIDEAAAATPFGRIAQPEDIAQAAAYLASAESDFMTGLAINVSGGMHMV